MLNIPQFGAPLEKYVERPGAYAIIVKDGKVLTVEVGGFYHLPGGGIDPGETSEQTLIREVGEETGYLITDHQFLGKANQYIAETELGPLNKMGYFYLATAVEIDPALLVEDDHIIKWLPREEVADCLMSDFQKWAVEQYFSNKN